MTFKRITLNSPDPGAAAGFLVDVLGYKRVESGTPALVERGGSEVAILEGPAQRPPVVLTVMADAWQKTTEACEAAGAVSLESLDSAGHRSVFFRTPGELTLEVVHRRRGRR